MSRKKDERGRKKDPLRAGLKACATPSSVARQDVVRQRQQRLALAAGRERGEARLRAVRVLDRPLVGELGRAVLAKQPDDVAPLFGGDGAIRDDGPDEAVSF